VTADNLLTTEPRPRNPVLADAFKRVGLVERTGRGVDLYRGMLRYGRPRPEYSRSTATSVVLQMSASEADLGLLTRIDTARLARTLGTLLANGVPILNALAIATQTIGNAALREALGETAIAVKEGKGVADPLARSGLFPQLAVRLVAVGERSGHLEAMLLKIADIYDGEVRSTVDRLMSLLVPALTLALGVVIATIIGAVLMAILSAYELPL
jgi:hypothetical protein